MPPVRILYIIERMGPGGTEKQLEALINGCDSSAKIQSHLCALRPSLSFFSSLLIPKIELGIEGIAMPYTAIQIRRLIRFCQHHHINLIQTFFQDPTLVGAVVKTVLPVKLLISFRDLGFWRRPIENLKMRLSYPLADGFIANSRAVKDNFVQFDGIDPDKIKVIYNGVSTVKQEQRGADPKKKPLIVGIVANLNRPVKRVEDFIKSAALVRRRHPEVRFLVVGDGHLKPQLEALSKTLGIAEALTFTGLVQNPMEFISDFHVGVITSETEGFCNAILEYMACGVPVVATAVGGNLELVRDGENGFLVPVGDVKWIAEKIEMLLRDDALRARMREANMQRVASDFTLSKMVASHESFYERILEI
jgi:L-malate glycosyltransferase